MITADPSGVVTFRIYAPHADQVELLADFSHWERGRYPMSRGEGDDEGWWYVTALVPEGDHAFVYLVDGRCWLPDYAASGVKRNEYGNWVSLISVPEHSRAPLRLVPDDAADASGQEHHELALAEHLDIVLRESWRIDGCCNAAHPLAG